MVCSTPLGWPLEPDVYRMNSGSSGAMSAGHSVSPARLLRGTEIAQRIMSTAAPVRLTTTTQSTPPAFAIAASTLPSAAPLAAAHPSSAVMMTLDWQSVMRWARLSAIEAGEHHRMNGADRAQASIA